MRVQWISRRPWPGPTCVTKYRLKYHEFALRVARTAARQAAQAGDDGTNDLLGSQVIRTNELQVWFSAEHLVDVPLTRAE